MQIKNKSDQRKYYKSKRSELCADVKSELDTKICDNFIEFALKHKKKLFLMYVSNSFEVDTIRALSKLFDLKIKVAVPRCEKNSNLMNFYYINSSDDLEKGLFGISEPKNCCEKVSSFDDAICVVPAICYDKSGYRIGYGKGFYDRFLSENNCFLKIGLCYEEFVIDNVLADDYDITVDMILTESYIHERSKL